MKEIIIGVLIVAPVCAAIFIAVIKKCNKIIDDAVNSAFFDHFAGISKMVVLTKEVKKMIDKKTHKIIAKCYGVWGNSRYYRTENGETFSITNGKHFFYHGNANMKNQSIEYLSGNRLKEIQSIILFVE